VQLHCQAMADAMAIPQNVRICLNVGGTVIHTSLHTMMEGARQGGIIFQCLCVQILGPSAPDGPEAGRQKDRSSSWAQQVVPARAEQYRREHFVDADPTPFAYWLDYLRSGQVPFVEAGPKREKVQLWMDFSACV